MPTFEQLVADESGFSNLSRLLGQLAGINMVDSPKNRTLMASRLYQIMSRHGLAGYEALANRLAENDELILAEFIDALTTNKTDFFREANHFEILKKRLPAAPPVDPWRVWCAAASTGEEPYSILFTLFDIWPELDYGQIRFLASDINQSVLKKASKGVYTIPQLAGLPRHLLAHYFVRISDDKGSARYKVRDDLRNFITFAPFNLNTEAYSFQYSFDVIFCRNVLIYFDQATTEQVVRKLCGTLKVGGLLFLGHTEVSSPKPPNLETVGVGVYQKVREGP